MSKTYDFNQVTVVIGTHVVTGLQSITITPVADVSRTEYDAQGNSGRIMTNNTNFTCSLVVSMFSPSNDTLSVFYNLGKAVTLPMTVAANANGATLFSSIGAYIEQIPEVILDNNYNDRTWGLMLTKAGWNLGAVGQ
jgi:hypothetical protein